MITAIIVDDEQYCCETLSILLERHCPEVEVLAVCNSGESGLQAIKDHHPQLVFLDIEMPSMNGFEMLAKMPNVNFELIITTSYDQYAIKAIRFSALDYLLKPIDRKELESAVQKVVHRSYHQLTEQLEILLQQLHRPTKPMNRIAMPTMEGLQLIPVESIISCTAESNYSVLLLKNKQKLIISRTLKETEEMLEDYSFLRVHNSSIVNLNEINKYIKGEGGYLLMSDGSTIDVSRSKKESLLQKLRPYKY